jgi:hypothetical protein
MEVADETAGDLTGEEWADYERAELEEAEREIERGEVASDDDVAEIYRLARR